MEKWQSGEQNLPDLEAWLFNHSFSYAKWLMENDAELQKWLEKNDASLEEFEGKKFLVERDEEITLRDYDQNTIHEKLGQAYFDQRAYDNLWERAMNNNRIEYDRSRWSKTNKKPA